MSPLVKTDEELLQLAQDIEDGKVFTMGHIPMKDRDLITSIFSDVENFEGGLIYQYYDEALEGIYLTDYPIFSHSCQLTSEEVIRTFTLLYSKGV
tara:strand:- start:1956 stop:2240 length:285 start_codon:yes stop_codon:yes gene_type:complete